MIIDLFSYLVDKKKKIVESTSMDSNIVGTWRGFGWTVGPIGHPLMDTLYINDIKRNCILPLKEINESSVTTINGKCIKLSDLVESKEYELVDEDRKTIQIDKNKKVEIKEDKGKDINEAERKAGAKVRNRGKCVFPADSPKVKDDKDHFPIGDIGHARNALSRSAQYSFVPSWYKGSLTSLKNAVKKAVKKAFPSIEVSESAWLKSNGIDLKEEKEFEEEVKNNVEEGIAPDFNKDGEEAQRQKLVEEDDDEELKLEDEEVPDEEGGEGEVGGGVEGEIPADIPADKDGDVGPVGPGPSDGVEEEPEEELGEEVPSINKKMLFGVNNEGNINYSIEPVFKGEDKLEDVIIKDQEDKQVWSAKESDDLDITNSTQVILRAIRDMDVMITKDLFMTYLYEPLSHEAEEIPGEEAAEKEEKEEDVEETRESVAAAYKEAKDAIAEYNAANAEKVDEKVSKSVRAKEKKKDKLKKKAQKAIDKYNKAKDKYKAAKVKEDEKEAAKAEKKAAKEAPKDDAGGEMDETYHEDVAEAKNSADAVGKSMNLRNIEKGGKVNKDKKDEEVLKPKQEKASESVEVECNGDKFSVVVVENKLSNITTISLNGVEFGFNNEFIMDSCGLKEAKLDNDTLRIFAKKVLESMDKEEYDKLVKSNK